MFKKHHLFTLATAALLTTLVAGPVMAQTCSEETAETFALMEEVAALDVPIENALMVELASAMVGLATADIDAVVSDLESFITKVDRQRGKQIGVAEAEQLIAAAEAILEDLTAVCPCLVFPEFSAIVDGSDPVVTCVTEPASLDYAILFGTSGAEIGAEVGGSAVNSCYASGVGFFNFQSPVDIQVCLDLLFQAASDEGVTCGPPPEPVLCSEQDPPPGTFFTACVATCSGVEIPGSFDDCGAAAPVCCGLDF